MVIKLIFDIEGKMYYHRVNSYKIENDFYIFRDIVSGIEKKYHKSLLRGEEKLG